MIAALSLAAALQPITLETPLLPMAQVLDQMERQTALKLKAEGGAALDVLMVRFKGRPLSEVLDGLAEAVDGRWTKNGGEWTLSAELPQSDAPWDQADAERLINALPRLEPIDQEGLKVLLREDALDREAVGSQWGKGLRGRPESLEKRMQERRLPLRRIYLDALRLLGPGSLVGMSHRDVRVFQAGPSELQFPMPANVESRLRAAAAESYALRKSLAQAGSLLPTLGEPIMDGQLALSPLRIELSRWDDSVGIALYVEAANGIGERIWERLGSLGSDLFTTRAGAMTFPTGLGARFPDNAEVNELMTSPRDPEAWLQRMAGMADAEPLSGPISLYARQLAGEEGDAIVILGDAFLDPDVQSTAFLGGSVTMEEDDKPVRLEGAKGLTIVRPADLVRSRFRIPRDLGGQMFAEAKSGKELGLVDAAHRLRKLSPEAFTRLLEVGRSAFGGADVLGYANAHRLPFEVLGALRPEELGLAASESLSMSLSEFAARWPNQARRLMTDPETITELAGEGNANSRSWSTFGYRRKGVASLQKRVNADPSVQLAGAWPPEGRVEMKLQTGRVLAHAYLGQGYMEAKAQELKEDGELVSMTMEPRAGLESKWAVKPFEQFGIRILYSSGLTQTRVAAPWPTFSREDFGPLSGLPSDIRQRIVASEP